MTERAEEVAREIAEKLYKLHPEVDQEKDAALWHKIESIERDRAVAIITPFLRAHADEAVREAEKKTECWYLELDPDTCRVTTPFDLCPACLVKALREAEVILQQRNAENVKLLLESQAALREKEQEIARYKEWADRMQGIDAVPVEAYTQMAKRAEAAEKCAAAIIEQAVLEVQKAFDHPNGWWAATEKQLIAAIRALSAWEEGKK
jgi:hypothetical protein